MVRMDSDASDPRLDFGKIPWERSPECRVPSGKAGFRLPLSMILLGFESR